MPDDKILQVITNEAKSTIDGMHIVTPSVYASVFSKHASAHQQELSDDTELATEIIKSECSTLIEMQTHTAKSAKLLSDSTSKAITAIKDKDESTLNQILKETQTLKHELEKLKEAVYKDELTHAYNRKWLHDHYLVEDSKSFNTNGTLAMIDLNYFKIINDTYGHIIGDKVLVFISNQLKTIAKEVVRYGGDEFIILFPTSISAGKAKHVINELREHVITKKLKANNEMFRTSFSIGVSPFSKGDKLSDTIEKADQNMYDDKTAIKKKITGIQA